MKRFMIIAVALLLAAGIVYAKDYELTKKAGGYNVTVLIDKNPPVTGDNTMAVKVQDASGKDITDAKVKVEYSMPAMPGMPAMNYKTDAALNSGAYKAKVNFPMSGAWNVVVKITSGAKTTPVKMNIDVR